DPGEVVLTDSIGVNLYKLLSAALTLRPDRKVIVMEGSNFPTDNYIAEGLIEQLGGAYEIRYVEEEQLAAAIKEDVAVVCLTQVHYRTGRLLDMSAITALTHAAGAISIWDLSHSAGALQVALNQCNVDFAVGCTYKYLNGGPGSPAFIFGAARHHGKALQPLTGWWGHAAPFDFEQNYRPAEGIRQMLCGTQSAISMALAEVGVDIFLKTDMAAIESKSRAMTDLFIQLIEQRCGGMGFDIESPRDAYSRGSQVALSHTQGYAIIQALIARGVIGDFRAPATLRFGFAPLYLRYADVWDAVEDLRQVMINEEWRKPDYQQRQAVT
ncbi:MAG: kynureninase, partial [Halieaceae bacterium]